MDVFDFRKLLEDDEPLLRRLFTADNSRLLVVMVVDTDRDDALIVLPQPKTKVARGQHLVAHQVVVLQSVTTIVTYHSFG